MKQFYTYIHSRPDGTPFYIGKGCEKRSHHFYKRNKYHNSIVAKYGKENIIVSIFYCESEEQSHKDEIQQIAQLRNEGYRLANLTDGGEGSSGLIASVETREKMSASQRGKKRPSEVILKISEKNKGKKRTIELGSICLK